MVILTDRRHRRVLLLAGLDPDAPARALRPDDHVGPLDRPLGVCLHDARFVLVADSGNDRIVVFDAVRNAWSACVQSGVFDAPRSIASDGGGSLLVADARRVVRVGDETGDEPSEVYAAHPGRRPLAVCGRDGMELDVALARGRLARSRDGGRSWRTVHLLGEHTSVPVALASAPEPGAPTYVCDAGNGRVLEVGPGDEVRTVLDGSHGLVRPTAIAVTAGGAVGDVVDLVVADGVENRVSRYVRSDAGGFEPGAPAEAVDGHCHDGTLRFDQVGGLAIGSF